MTRQSSDLKAVPLKFVPEKTIEDHAGYEREGSFNTTGFVSFSALEAFVHRHIARLSSPKYIIKRPARFAVIQGKPGDGKTDGIRHACLTKGVDIMNISSSELSGATEGASVEALDAIIEEIVRISLREDRLIALILEDADLGIMVRDNKTEGTVNSQLVMQRLQFIASNSNVLLNGRGLPVPMFITGNDFSMMRSSLFRPGRAVFYTHAPTLEEKQAIVSSFFPTKSPEGKKQIDGLVTDYSDQPVSFFNDLRSRIDDDHLDSLIAEHGLNLTAIEEAASPSLNLNMLRSAAERLAANRAENFIDEKENNDAAA